MKQARRHNSIAISVGDSVGATRTLRPSLTTVVVDQSTGPVLIGGQWWHTKSKSRPPALKPAPIDAARQQYRADIGFIAVSDRYRGDTRGLV